MYSRLGFPFSMENIPRQSGFLCLSLRFGCIVTALIAIIYSVLGLTQCGLALNDLPNNVDEATRIFILTVLIISVLCYGVTFVLSAFLFVGVIWDKLKFMKPWICWFTFQTIVLVGLFVFFTTIQMINHFVDINLLVYVVEFLILVVRIYMLILVVSYYKHVKEEWMQSQHLQKLVNNEFNYYSIS